jgi:hypothetical protein
MEHLPRYEFQKCVARYRGDYQQKGFSCWEQFLAMGFAQFTYRESLRDIESCLRSVSGKLYHMGFRSKVARSTLADANESNGGEPLCRETTITSGQDGVKIILAAPVLSNIRPLLLQPVPCYKDLVRDTVTKNAKPS